ECSDFHVRDGLLYFDSGLVYDPSTRKTVGRIAGLGLLSYVLPRQEGLLDVLTRVTDVWRIRRLNATNLQEVASLEIGKLPQGETAQEAVVLQNELAFRTATSVYIVSLDGGLDPSELRLVASQTTPGQITLRFASVQGSDYRIEHSTQISPNWSSLRDNL